LRTYKKSNSIFANFVTFCLSCMFKLLLHVYLVRLQEMLSNCRSFCRGMVVYRILWTLCLALRILYLLSLLSSHRNFMYRLTLYYSRITSLNDTNKSTACPSANDLFSISISSRFSASLSACLLLLHPFNLCNNVTP
jgi:hypothetical protein